MEAKAGYSWIQQNEREQRTKQKSVFVIEVGGCRNRKGLRSALVYMRAGLYANGRMIQKEERGPQINRGRPRDTQEQ